MSDDPDTALRHALALHRSGDAAGAVTLYRRLLPHLPGNALLLLVLGTALSQLGQCEEGVVWLGKSLALEPDQVMALSNRGNALRLLKRYAEALADYDRAIALQPGYAEAHFNRAIALADLKRFDEAIAGFTTAIAIVPNYTDAYFERGSAFAELKRPDNALADFDRAVTLDPRHAKAWTSRGNAQLDLGRTADALASFARAIAADPRLADAHHNRGCALEKAGRLEEAAAAFDCAVTLDPGRVDAHYNRGCVLEKLGCFDDALASYDRAIAAKPENADAHNNRGAALKASGRFDEARANFRAALAADPDHIAAHYNIATLALLRGDYDEGWPLYEWRWKLKSWDTPIRDFRKPMWAGEDVAGKTLLVHPEQGFGDIVFSCRYIPMAAALGAKVIVETPKRLQPLLETMKGDYVFVETGQPLPPFDLHCPIMSLPLAFKTRVENIPADVPYLFADPVKVEEISRKLKPGPHVGIVWSGNPKHHTDHERSIALRRFEPLLRLPFAFHALQIEIRPEDMAALPAGVHLHQHDQNDFSDAAALIAAMDLVVTVDTVVAHVAGALGKPVWVLLPWLPDWRWMLDRGDSPWYPSARLFRQPARGDWDSVIAGVSARLKDEYPFS